ncbi:hypothetical protein C7S14_0306 [Burkholderia cepacia]|nr:hypothetical protein C7S14_0306 [Burkholderia cepacia]
MKGSEHVDLRGLDEVADTVAAFRNANDRKRGVIAGEGEVSCRCATRRRKYAEAGRDAPRRNYVGACHVPPRAGTLGRRIVRQ